VNDASLHRTRLQAAIRECQLHLNRLNHARKKLAELFPLSIEKWHGLDDDTIADLDQLLFRFGRLQDAMGKRMFRHILEASLEWDEDETFIDKLARLERLKVLPSSEQWLMLRELRNSAMHEYPDQPELTVENLNRIHQAARTLETAFLQAAEFAKRLLARSA